MTLRIALKRRRTRCRRAERVLAWINAPFYLDYRRNRIFSVELAGLGTRAVGAAPGGTLFSVAIPGSGDATHRVLPRLCLRHGGARAVPHRTGTQFHARAPPVAQGCTGHLRQGRLYYLPPEKCRVRAASFPYSSRYPSTIRLNPNRSSARSLTFRRSRASVAGNSAPIFPISGA